MHAGFSIAQPPSASPLFLQVFSLLCSHFLLCRSHPRIFRQLMHLWHDLLNEGRRHFDWRGTCAISINRRVCYAQSSQTDWKCQYVSMFLSNWPHLRSVMAGTRTRDIALSSGLGCLAEFSGNRSIDVLIQMCMPHRKLEVEWQRIQLARLSRLSTWSTCRLHIPQHTLVTLSPHPNVSDLELLQNFQLSSTNIYS